MRPTPPIFQTRHALDETGGPAWRARATALGALCLLLLPILVVTGAAAPAALALPAAVGTLGVELLGVDPARIAIGGESAGGTLSAGLALLARDRAGPAICFLAIHGLDDRLETPSMIQFVDTPIVNRPNAIGCWQLYLGGRPADQYAAPARAEDLSKLPPAYVSVCEFDPLRDEDLIYAHRLIQAGVPTEVHHFPGTFHGSTIVATAKVSARMNAEMLDALRQALTG